MKLLPGSRVGAAGLLLLVTVSCGSDGEPASTESSPPSKGLASSESSDVAPPAGLVDVGDRSIFLECKGSGSLTVVLEAGLTGDSRTWERVAPTIADKTRVCAYDRANIGRSDAAPTPRTAQEMVDDLNAALRAAGERSPFVLVGFSFGGLVSQLYASAYPSEVAGIVLVESSHPDEVDVFQSHLTEAQVAEDRAAIQDNPEGVDVLASFAQAQVAVDLPAVPLVVVSAARSDGWPPDWDAELFDRLRTQQQRQLAALAPGGQRVIADDSGHNVPLEQPEAVIAAIVTVVTKSR